MSTEFVAGDSVQIVERDLMSADTKSGLYYAHYRGLTGSVGKVYADGTVSVTVDPPSLPDDLRQRHEAGSEAQRRKWLDGLSDEARNRLTASEKQFSLRYSVLVSKTDLQKIDRKRTEDLDDAETKFLESRRQKG